MNEPTKLPTWEELSHETRALTERELAAWFARRKRDYGGLGADVVAIHEASRELTMRSAKRVRPALVAAAYAVCGGAGGPSAIAPALVAFELLQSSLLIHDDLIDGDPVRRGGPAVHVMLRGHLSADAEGMAGAVLAGDHAGAEAFVAMSELSLPPERVVAALKELASVFSAVLLGQVLDMGPSPRSLQEVERVHEQKTATYTTSGPIALGALLAGARPDVLTALDAFARPLGVAFQLEDDLLGAFSSSDRSGKTRGADIAAGKHTALTAELLSLGVAEDRALLDAARTSSEHVEKAIARFEQSGTRARVEARAAELLAQARAALGAPLLVRALTPSGRALLEGAAFALSKRDR